MVGLNPAEPKSEISAPLVFVGYGLEVPKHGYDDYRGLDVKGKIVVILRASRRECLARSRPMPPTTKAEAAAKHGAIGIVSIDTLAFGQAPPLRASARISPTA
jgi:hypothetical protein